MFNEIQQSAESAQDRSQECKNDTRNFHADSQKIQMQPRELWFGLLIFFLAGFMLGGLSVAALLTNH